MLDGASASVRYRRGVSLPDSRTPATLDAHDGELLDRADAPLLWLGEMTPQLLADLMRSGSHGAVRVRALDGEAHDVWIQRCWYDVEEGKMVVQLHQRSDPS